MNDKIFDANGLCITTNPVGGLYVSTENDYAKLEPASVMALHEALRNHIGKLIIDEASKHSPSDSRILTIDLLHAEQLESLGFATVFREVNTGVWRATARPFLPPNTNLGFNVTKP